LDHAISVVLPWARRILDQQVLAIQKLKHRFDAQLGAGFQMTWPPSTIQQIHRASID